MENYLDTLFDQSNELYLKYINNYISIKRLKKVIHQYPNYIKNDNVILKIFFKKKDGIIINADINGSGNIMRKAIPNCLTTNGIEGFVVSPVRITPKGYYPYKQVS